RVDANSRVRLAQFVGDAAGEHTGSGQREIDAFGRLTRAYRDGQASLQRTSLAVLYVDVAGPASRNEIRALWKPCHLELTLRVGVRQDGAREGIDAVADYSYARTAKGLARVGSRDAPADGTWLLLSG